MRLLTFVVPLAIALHAHGQCSSTWQSTGGLPGVNGTVSAAVSWDPDGDGPQAEMLVVAGDITVAGDTFVHGLAAWDGARWHDLAPGGGLMLTRSERGAMGRSRVATPW